MELPAGPAERVDFAANESGGRWSVYALSDDSFVRELWCRGDELSAGRTGLADISFDDGSRAMRNSFGHEDGRILALCCLGDPTPDDRYLSLAASLEWFEPT